MAVTRLGNPNNILEHVNYVSIYIKIMLGSIENILRLGFFYFLYFAWHGKYSSKVYWVSLFSFLFTLKNHFTVRPVWTLWVRVGSLKASVPGVITCRTPDLTILSICQVQPFIDWKNLEGGMLVGWLFVTLATVMMLLWHLKMLKLSHYSLWRRLIIQIIHMKHVIQI